MLTMLQELNIDCFQGYGNNCSKDYHMANDSIRPSHFRGASFVADVASLSLLQKTADARRYTCGKYYIE